MVLAKHAWQLYICLACIDQLPPLKSHMVYIKHDWSNCMFELEFLDLVRLRWFKLLLVSKVKWHTLLEMHDKQTSTAQIIILGVDGTNSVHEMFVTLQCTWH